MPSSVAPQRSRQLGPGDKLGKYEVIRQIAIGGMAELYLARTLGIEGFEKLVVVKRILPQYVANATFVNMFLNEARIAATLHHPNVAQVYDIGLDEGDYFFAMEYVHGEDLDHISIASEEQGVPISLDAALTLAAGLCAGLHYAHERVSVDGKPQEIVHRDVSPSNVIVSYDGAVKLVDFGIARAASRPGTTATGGLKGKIAYMSPEQCKAKAKLDRRTDIYAVGTLLYELTTGTLPFSGETEYQILNQIVNEDVPAPTTIVPEYPPALEAILLKALARDPNARYRTALELQGAIEDFAHETRLRISPLVLGRLMGTLFPARLEEWDHAKKQGAFFVEQHVVRTLIESGKTPDPDDPAIKAAILAAEARQKAAEEAARRVLAVGDDDTTAVNHSLTDLGGDTNVGSPPISMEATVVDSVPLPPQPLVVNIIQSGTPPGGSPYPLISAAQAGTLFSSSQSSPRVPAGVVEPTSAVADITEQVRVPSRRQSSPTIFVRTKSKKPVYIVAGSIVLAGALAAFIAVRSGGKPTPAASRPAAQQEDRHESMKVEMPPSPPPPPTQTAAEPPPAPTPAPPPAPTVETPAVADTPEPTVAAKTDEKKPEPKHAVEKKTVAATRPKPIARSTPKLEAKTEPKPESKPAKPEPKQETKKWNADSPFMPVRTGK